ncbi:MAG: hypothetical protein SR1Q5_00210 [Quinella sp. 1Q5]|nr:hypothetical protein [Quinella sp. 1Q5]
MRDKNFLPLIIFALIIILPFCWWQFIYKPAQREILAMKLETRRLREVEREIMELKACHENLSAFVEAKELELDAARDFLPATLEQDKFIDELYRAADFHRARIISVQTDDATSETLQAQVVNVKLEADYISLLNVLRAILDGERLTNLEKFSVEHKVGRILSCEISFKIFATSP